MSAIKTQRKLSIECLFDFVNRKLMIENKR
jgi:hypothetical protein